VSHPSLPASLAQIRARIAAAAKQCGRDPLSVHLLAVSKLHPVSTLRELASYGQRQIGESYLQEALPKMAALTDLDIEWHYIGQIQSNKTRPIADHFQWAHTVDRLKIAQRLNEQRTDHAPPLNVCIQVKLAEEAGKGGVAPSDVFALAKAVAALPRLRLRGLMCLPPPCEQFGEQLSFFEQCAALQKALNDSGLALDTLSMGMSDDLEAAITAGATIVRVGTALFGPRDARAPGL
jgi:pyridoxal phosphate enzyme (YggS family)